MLSVILQIWNKYSTTPCLCQGPFALSMAAFARRLFSPPPAAVPAVALVGVMAVSMLTGCALSDKIAEKQVLNAMSTVVGATVKSDDDAEKAAGEAKKAAIKAAGDKFGDEAAEAVAAYNTNVKITKDGKDVEYKVVVKQYKKSEDAKDYAQDLVKGLGLEMHKKATVGVEVFEKEFGKTSTSDKSKTKYYFVAAVVKAAA